VCAPFEADGTLLEPPKRNGWPKERSRRQAARGQLTVVDAPVGWAVIEFPLLRGIVRAG